MTMVGLLIFAGLNILMLQTNYDLWTNPKVGFYGAFHKGFEFSGFDDTTYIIVSKWRPLYEAMRHPLLANFIWPLSCLSEWIRETWKINPAIFIVAATWTLIDTLTWVLLYKMLRKVVVLTIKKSVMLTFFYYSLSHVMLASFIPDHMVLTQCLLIIALYLAGKQIHRRRAMKTWQALLLFFIATGVTTTNAAKIWLIDTVSRWRGRKPLRNIIIHSMLYLLPAAAIGGLYYWNQETAMREEKAFQDRVGKKRLENDKNGAFKKKIAKWDSWKEERESKQIIDHPLFAFTDVSVPIWPTLKDNIFGEGLQLHEDHLLQDANNKERPQFVTYHHWWNDMVEVLIILLFAIGIWCGRHERFLWTVMSVFLFDMIIHVVLRFALTDVYIMTAHWAMVMPVAIGYLLKKTAFHRGIDTITCTMITLLTIFLWWHNLSLIAGYILK